MKPFYQWFFFTSRLRKTPLQRFEHLRAATGSSLCATAHKVCEENLNAPPQTRLWKNASSWQRALRWAPQVSTHFCCPASPGSTAQHTAQPRNLRGLFGGCFFFCWLGFDAFNLATEHPKEQGIHSSHILSLKTQYGFLLLPNTFLDQGIRKAATSPCGYRCQLRRKRSGFWFLLPGPSVKCIW